MYPYPGSYRLVGRQSPSSDSIQSQFASLLPTRITLMTLASLNILFGLILVLAVVRVLIQQRQQILQRRSYQWRNKSRKERQQNRAQFLKMDLNPSSPLAKTTQVLGLVATSTEAVPLILGLAIITQASMYMAVQSRGLRELAILGCRDASRVTMLALFIVPVVQTVFCVECSIRSLRPSMSCRGRWLSWICGVFIITTFLTMGVVLSFEQPPNFCLASLMGFVLAFRKVCFVIFLILTILSILAGAVLILRLRKLEDVDTLERIAASALVYYSMGGAFIMLLMTVYFAYVSLSSDSPFVEKSIRLADLASVVSNLSGLIYGAVYLFLRSRWGINHSTIGNQLHLFASPTPSLLTKEHMEAGFSLPGLSPKQRSPNSVFSTTTSERALASQMSFILPLSPAFKSPANDPLQLANENRTNASFVNYSETYSSNDLATSTNTPKNFKKDTRDARAMGDARNEKKPESKPEKVANNSEADGILLPRLAYSPSSSRRKVNGSTKSSASSPNSETVTPISESSSSAIVGRAITSSLEIKSDVVYLAETKPSPARADAAVPPIVMTGPASPRKNKDNIVAVLGEIVPPPAFGETGVSRGIKRRDQASINVMSPVESLRYPGSDGSMSNSLLPPHGHRRDSSLASTGTVQIGLRLSNFNSIMMQNMNSDPTRVHSLRYNSTTPNTPLATSPTTATTPTGALDSLTADRNGSAEIGIALGYGVEPKPSVPSAYDFRLSQAPSLKAGPWRSSNYESPAAIRGPRTQFTPSTMLAAPLKQRQQYSFSQAKNEGQAGNVSERQRSKRSVYGESMLPTPMYSPTEPNGLMSNSAASPFIVSSQNEAFLTSNNHLMAINPRVPTIGQDEMSVASSDRYNESAYSYGYNCTNGEESEDDLDDSRSTIPNLRPDKLNVGSRNGPKSPAISDVSFEVSTSPSLAASSLATGVTGDDDRNGLPSQYAATSSPTVPPKARIVRMVSTRAKPIIIPPASGVARANSNATVHQSNIQNMDNKTADSSRSPTSSGLSSFTSIDSDVLTPSPSMPPLAQIRSPSVAAALPLAKSSVGSQRQGGVPFRPNRPSKEEELPPVPAPPPSISANPKTQQPRSKSRTSLWTAGNRTKKNESSSSPNTSLLAAGTGSAAGFKSIMETMDEPNRPTPSRGASPMLTSMSRSSPLGAPARSAGMTLVMKVTSPRGVGFQIPERPAQSRWI